jgi:hypothetical protein
VSLSFRPVFIAVVIACGLIVSAFLINRARPRVEQHQPSASFARATGKCAECHSQQQYSVVHEYEMSRHAQQSVNCLDCHKPAPAQSASRTDGAGAVQDAVNDDPFGVTKACRAYSHETHETHETNHEEHETTLNAETAETAEGERATTLVSAA